MKYWVNNESVLIRLARGGNALVRQALYTHKDYNMDCRNRILRLG